MAIVNAIPAAIEAVKSVLQAALDPLVGNRVYWQQSPEQTLTPCIVFHSRDGGGNAIERIGSVGWQGEITIRVFAATDTQAGLIAGQVVQAIPQTTKTTDGWTVTARLLRPVVQPPAKLASVAGFVYQITIQ